MILSHVSIRTKDIDALIRFWTDVIGLLVGSRQDLDGLPSVWLKGNDKPIIHAVYNPATESGAGSIGQIAIQGTNYRALIDRLWQHEVQFAECEIPELRQHKVLIPGPDNVLAEILFDVSATDS